MKENKERIDERMKKNKGFTLIELLAVIVILAIIALIAVPIVMNIINKANKSAFKDSAYGIIKAGELFYTSELLENAGLYADKTFTFPNDTEGLEIKGSKPTGGYVTVNKEGQVSMAVINGKYCVTKDFEDDDVKITDDVENCEIPDSSGNVLDNAWPIKWNTKDVVNNTSSSNGALVKVSNLIPTISELRNSQVSTVYDGTTIVCSYAGSENVDGLTMAMYKFDDNDMKFYAFSVSSAGEYDGITFNEPGLYATNLGYESMGGVDVDIVWEKIESPFPIQWNLLELSEESFVNSEDSEESYAMVSSFVPSIGLFENTVLKVSDSSISVSYDYLQTDSIDGGFVVLYTNGSAQVPVWVFTEAVTYRGLVVTEPGIYVSWVNTVPLEDYDIVIDFA